MTTPAAVRGPRPPATDWTPRATLVLHTQDEGIEVLRPEHLAERLPHVRERLRRSAGDDRSVCLVPDPRQPFAHYLTELLAALAMPHPVALLHAGSHASPVAELAGHGIRACTLRTAAGHEPLPAAPAPLPDQALLLRTGGSSGRSRFAVNTSMRRALVRDRRLSLARAVGLRDGARVLLAGPVGHAAHLSMLLDTVNHEAEVHLYESPDPARVLPDIRRHGIQWLTATPLHLRIMMRQMRDARGTAELEKLVHMSAACGEPVKRFWHSVLGPENVYEVFGSSEGIGTTIARGDEWERRPGTVGRGFYTSVAVLDPAGRPVPAGEPGDVYFAYGAPARPLHVGHGDHVRWTGNGLVGIGDRGFLDDDGFLHLETRPQLRITVGGTTVVATDVEDALLAFPWVHDAAAAGIANQVTGQRVIGFVVLDAHAPATWAAELAAELRQNLPAAAVPRHVFAVDSVPRAPSGKVDRAAIAALADAHSRKETE
ncbi:fatty acid--CoA ligase family protein [Streptomyces sp. NPDC046371]|uniref:class I adenylate-forming enzyme family protein n=1 Tax=unclassified Streptomyces TaxID=2593676 RepID=UPI0033EF565E